MAETSEKTSFPLSYIDFVLPWLAVTAARFVSTPQGNMVISVDGPTITLRFSGYPHSTRKRIHSGLDDLLVRCYEAFGPLVMGKIWVTEDLLMLVISLRSQRNTSPDTSPKNSPNPMIPDSTVELPSSLSCPDDLASVPPLSPPSSTS